MISVEEEGLLHKLDIINPVMADIGKFTCEINGVSTSAFLDVEGTYSLMFLEKDSIIKKLHNYLLYRYLRIFENIQVLQIYQYVKSIERHGSTYQNV